MVVKLLLAIAVLGLVHSYWEGSFLQAHANFIKGGPGYFRSDECQVPVDRDLEHEEEFTAVADSSHSLKGSANKSSSSTKWDECTVYQENCETKDRKPACCCEAGQNCEGTKCKCSDSKTGNCAKLCTLFKDEACCVGKDCNCCKGTDGKSCKAGTGCVCDKTKCDEKCKKDSSQGPACCKEGDTECKCCPIGNTCSPDGTCVDPDKCSTEKCTAQCGSKPPCCVDEKTCKCCESDEECTKTGGKDGEVTQECKKKPTCTSDSACDQQCKDAGLPSGCCAKTSKAIDPTCECCSAGFTCGNNPPPPADKSSLWELMSRGPTTDKRCQCDVEACQKTCQGNKVACCVKDSSGEAKCGCCPEGNKCDNGECKCDDTLCAQECKSCINGKCDGYTCKDTENCNDEGKCVSKCSDVVCDAKKCEKCDEKTGACQSTCVGGQQCNSDGNCETTPTVLCVPAICGLLCNGNCIGDKCVSGCENDCKNGKCPDAPGCNKDADCDSAKCEKCDTDTHACVTKCTDGETCDNAGTCETCDEAACGPGKTCPGPTTLKRGANMSRTIDCVCDDDKCKTDLCGTCDAEKKNCVPGCVSALCVGGTCQQCQKDADCKVENCEECDTTTHTCGPKQCEAGTTCDGEGDCECDETTCEAELCKKCSDDGKECVDKCPEGQTCNDSDGQCETPCDDSTCDPGKKCPGPNTLKRSASMTRVDGCVCDDVKCTEDLCGTCDAEKKNCVPGCSPALCVDGTCQCDKTTCESDLCKKCSEDGTECVDKCPEGQTCNDSDGQCETPCDDSSCGPGEKCPGPVTLKWAAANMSRVDGCECDPDKCKTDLCGTCGVDKKCAPGCTGSQTCDKTTGNCVTPCDATTCKPGQTCPTRDITTFSNGTSRDGSECVCNKKKCKKVCGTCNGKECTVGCPPDKCKNGKCQTGGCTKGDRKGCPEGHTCNAQGKCECATDGPEKCNDKECKKCIPNVGCVYRCKDDEKCVAEDELGRCKPINGCRKREDCNPLECLICDLLRGSCILSCPEGQICKDGACVDECDETECAANCGKCEDGTCTRSEPCPEGQTCEDGECKTPCDETKCNEGESCETRQLTMMNLLGKLEENKCVCDETKCLAADCNECKDGKCEKMTCPDGQTCTEGQCEPACDDSKCPSGTACKDGICKCTEGGCPGSCEMCFDIFGCYSRCNDETEICDEQTDKCKDKCDPEACRTDECGVCEKGKCQPGCPEGQTCRKGKCEGPSCKRDGECGPCEVCDQLRGCQPQCSGGWGCDEGACQPPSCDENACGPGETCQHPDDPDRVVTTGEQECLCDDEQCAKDLCGTCKNGKCVKNSCPKGQSCKNGKCQCDKNARPQCDENKCEVCGDAGCKKKCSSYQDCIKKKCVNKCDDKTCKKTCGKCIKGQCKNQCKADEECEDGTCKAPCDDTLCNPGETCDERNRDHRTNSTHVGVKWECLCNKKKCEQTCGSCKKGKCVPKDCPKGQSCTDGKCQCDSNACDLDNCEVCNLKTGCTSQCDDDEECVDRKCVAKSPCPDDCKSACKAQSREYIDGCCPNELDPNNDNNYDYNTNQRESFMRMIVAGRYGRAHRKGDGGEQCICCKKPYTCSRREGGCQCNPRLCAKVEKCGYCDGNQCKARTCPWGTVCDREKTECTCDSDKCQADCGSRKLGCCLNNNKCKCCQFPYVCPKNGGSDCDCEPGACKLICNGRCENNQCKPQCGQGQQCVGTTCTGGGGGWGGPAPAPSPNPSPPNPSPNPSPSPGWRARMMEWIGL